MDFKSKRDNGYIIKTKFDSYEFIKYVLQQKCEAVVEEHRLWSQKELALSPGSAIYYRPIGTVTQLSCASVSSTIKQELYICTHICTGINGHNIYIVEFLK